MASRKIDGTKHIRRRMRTRAKVAIGVVALALVSLSGYLFMTKTEQGQAMTGKVSGLTSIVGQVNSGFAAAGGGAPSTQVEEVSLNSSIKLTVKTQTLEKDGTVSSTKSGGYFTMSNEVAKYGVANFSARAFDGYIFQGWYDTGGNKKSGEYVISATSNTDTDSNGFYKIDADIRVTTTTTLTAVFKEVTHNGEPTLGDVASSDQFSFAAYSYPAVGQIGINAAYKNLGDSDSSTSSSGFGSTSIWSPEGAKSISSIEVTVRVPYSEAASLWTVDSMMGSDKDHGDTFPHNRSVKASFIAYLKISPRSGVSGSTSWRTKEITRYARMNGYDSTDDAVFTFKNGETDLWDSTTPEVGYDYYLYLVPITQQGTTYQVMASSNDWRQGTATGDVSSAKPFSTTIKATPYEGYKFDYWRKNRFGSDSTYREIYDESTLNVNCNDPGIDFYTAHFKKATYKVYASEIPSDGGDITITGNALDDSTGAIDEKTGGPGKLDYAYLYETDSNSPDYEKVVKKPSVTVNITPKDGYHIENWSYTLEDRGTVTGDSDTFVIADFDQDINIQVKYSNGKSRIEVKASPVDGGAATVQKQIIDSTGAEKSRGSIKSDYEEFSPANTSGSGDIENAILAATPADSSHVFLYWTDSQNKKYEDNPLTIKNVASSEKFTANFAPSKIKIITEKYPTQDDSGNPVDPGSVIVTGDTVVQDSTNTNEYTAEPNKSITIKATENEGYHFQKFVDNNGKEYTSNPLVMSDLVTDTTLTAVFVDDEFDITAVASPITGGSVTVNGKSGSNTVKYGNDVTLVATPNADYDFLYFEDQNGKKYEGSNTLAFKAVNGRETYKAIFVSKKISLGINISPDTLSDTKYEAGKLEVTCKKSGETEYTDVPIDAPTAEITDIQSKTNITIKATENTKYHFVKFVDENGTSYADNPLTLVNVTDNKRITAVFAPEEFEIKAIASPSTGGVVKIGKVLDDKGREGSAAFSYGDDVYLVAEPAANYALRYFEDQNGNKYSGTETTINGKKYYYGKFKAVNGPETYKAVFAMSSVSVSVKVDPSMKDTEAGHTDEYLAGGYSVSYTSAEPADPSNPNVDTGALYTASTISNIKGQTSVKITAIPKSGYRFSKFIDDEGNTWTESILVLGDLVENKNIEIIYVPEKFEIKAQASPSTGGNVKIKVDHNGTITEREGSNTASYNDEVTLTATPENGYVFRYFEDANGNQYKQNVDPGTGVATFTFKAVNGAESYKAVFGMRSVRYTIDVYPKDKDSDDKYYIAGGYEITYVDNSNGQEYIVEKYEEGSFGYIRAEKGVKIRALEQNGYHFVRFVDSKGQSYTENPLVRPDIVESDNITIIFEEDDLTVNVVVSPDKGGTATANGKAGTTKVKYGEWVNINAKPNPGYMFRYFEDQDGNHYEGIENADGSNTYSFKAVNASTTFKAIFVQQTLSLEMIYDPVDTTKCGVVVTYQSPHGELNVTDPFRNQINDIVGMTDIKIKAIEKSGYKFLKFVDGTGRVYNDNPLVLPSVTENQKITAIFVEEHWRIDTKSSPETGGRVTINDIEGGLDVNYGQHVKIEAKPNTGYKFLYFKDSNGSEYMSNPLEFDVINGSETYTAYFAKNDVNITIDLAPAGAGTVRFNSEPAVSGEKTYPTDGASSVTLTATPKDDYKFLYWKDQDGNTYPDNPLVVVNISRDLKFTAVFDSKFDTIRAVASPASGGKITKIINDDGSITLIATANRGYKFTSWKKPNGRTFAFKFTIPADQVHTGDTYTAYFKIIPGYDMKSDITKEKFYREWRKVITPNYTVTRDYMQLLAMQSVAGLRQYDDATPGLKSYSAYGNAKAYFDSKTGDAVKRLDLVFGDCELMTAESEVLTPDLLPDADNYLAVAEKFTDKKFGKKYDTEILTVKRVLEPDDFDAKKRTYLWRYTGAEYEDNIYLLYDISDSKPKYVTPIVDEDGVLKFTIDKLENNDVVAVVRVKIK